MPIALGLGEWKEWHVRAKDKVGPFKYWLLTTFLCKSQDIVEWPGEQVMKAVRYLRNRFTSKTHVLPTGLKRGVWHDADERILYGCFQALVDYVEVELGQELDKRGWLIQKLERLMWWKERRSAKAGIRNLTDQRNLANGVDPSDPMRAALQRQASTAGELYNLYIWWTLERKLIDEDEVYETDTEMLKRLVDVRSAMWS